MALNNDDRVQQHHHNIFKCNYLPDKVQHLRKKLELYFNVESGNEILQTEPTTIKKADGNKSRIGIYRIAPSYKKEIRKYLNKAIK